MTRDDEETTTSAKGKGRSKSGTYRPVKDGDLANPIQLDEFLGGVGQVLRLEPKDLPKPEKPTERVRFRMPANWGRLVLPMLALVLVPLVVKRSPKHEAAPTATVLPDGVEGIWTTQDPRYAGRQFQIENGYIAFKNGDRADDQSLHQISAVKTDMAGDSTLVQISYLEADATYELAFKYVRFPTPGIRFAHQEELVWRKAPPVKLQEVKR
jgi:hypothetical protein